MGKIVKLKNKKTGERVYPVTATKAVVDADSGERLNDVLLNKVEEAPMDGAQYVRKNAAWNRLGDDEKCRITLHSNQGEADDLSLIGASIKVINTNTREIYLDTTWNGSELLCSVPAGVTYKIICGAIANYSTPVEKVFNATPFDSRAVSLVYSTEIVNVVLKTNNGVSAANQKVTINGVTKTFDGTNAVSQKVPFGSSYSVSANGKTAYITPTTQTFTASQISRNIELEYIYEPKGLFIQGVSGMLYSKDEWNNQETVNGVALFTDNCQFVVALKKNSDYWGGKWSTSGNTPSSGILVNAAESVAITDYKGKENTDVLVSDSPNQYDTTAPVMCRKYIFPNGKTGYLGSAGEWKALMDNYNDFVSIYNGKLGGEFVIKMGYRYWTSTCYDTTNAWLVYSSTNLSPETVGNENLYLPFGSI